MNKLTYKELTLEEKEFLTDGCGNYILDVPDFMWTEACRKHDFGYWSGYTKADRSNTDSEWLSEMIDDVNKADPHTLNHGGWVYKFVAIIYFVFVRMFSGKYFEYGDRYKTRADLEAEMKDGNV